MWFGAFEAVSGVFEVPLFRPCGLHRRLEIPLDPLLALLVLGPDQVELALSLCLG